MYLFTGSVFSEPEALRVYKGRLWGELQSRKVVAFFSTLKSVFDASSYFVPLGAKMYLQYEQTVQ